MRLQTASAVAGYQDECQDRVDILRIGESVVLAVADGVGGRGGGTRAAELAIEYIRSGVQNMPQQACADCENLNSLLSTIDDALWQDDEAGETTAVLAVVSPATLVDVVLGASVGDSGAWLITAGGYNDMTENQRLDSRHGCYPGFLGSGEAMPFWFGEALGDSTVLLATDGLFKYADPDAICSICRGADLQSAAQRLIDLVRLPSGALHDDVAVALCRRT